MEDSRLSWEMSPQEAHEINKIHKSGKKTWEELCMEYMDDNGIPQTTTPDKHKEYFRRLVGRKNKEYEEDNEVRSLTDSLQQLLSREDDEEITVDLIHRITRMSRKDFKLSGRINTSMWGTMSKEAFETAYRNGAIKLQWEVRDFLFDEELFTESLKNIEPMYVDTSPVEADERLLVIPFFDPHFGVATAETYKATAARTISIMRERKRDTTLFIVGQDMIHTDDLKGHTSNGTPIGKIDFNKAIDDAVKFYSTLIEEALVNSDNVILSYSKGNHDETVGSLVARILHERYPQTELDVTLDEYKLFKYHNVRIGYTHGDKVPRGRNGKQRIHDFYLSQFPEDFLMVNSRYILTGHYHNFTVLDELGTLVYTLSTRKPADEWHVEKAFVGAQKFFTIFEYDKYGEIGTRRV